jgi:hypothetical protein
MNGFAKSVEVGVGLVGFWALRIARLRQAEPAEL